ncbi:MAG: hypothetical protein M1836_001901 [Candelina mexicana]|nr:MAG: hypothetical protein M1836_001901 [Candelina mexicana]
MASQNSANDSTGSTSITHNYIGSYFGPDNEIWYVVPKYSDGRLRVMSEAGHLQENRPAGAEYSKCGDGHPTAMMWMRKLASMAEELNDDPRAQGMPHELRKFPANYALYEKSSGERRKDYFLYGYPILGKYGQSQVFRSAAEFHRHFFWLLDDVDAQCGCKLCWVSGKPLVNTNRYLNANGANEAMADGDGEDEEMGSGEGEDEEKEEKGEEWVDEEVVGGFLGSKEGTVGNEEDMEMDDESSEEGEEEGDGDYED